ncbi:MAG: hypothetical protein ABSC21_15400 [Terriglobia bacterium]|jgi:hypothetical protein
MNEQLLEETLCVQRHPDAREWYTPHCHEPDTIDLSAHQIFTGVLEYRHSETWMPGVKIQYGYGTWPHRRIYKKRRIPVPDVQSTFQEHRQTDEAGLVHSFRELVEQWKNNTGHWSSTTRRIADPSYLRIIGLARNSTGHQIERLLLHELQNEPDDWFDALAAITGVDPVKPEHDFDEAIDAWVEWGREKGII